MNEAVTEGEFAMYLDAMTAYGSERKTLILRCTCPTPEGCVCDRSDDENGETMTCSACSEMRHTEADCMVYVLSNWKQAAPALTMLEPGHVPPLPPGPARRVEGWLP